MIVLDTNVLSELMRAAPAGEVVDWVSSRPASELFTTTITLAEISYGLALLPAGRRRATLAAAVDEMFEQDFAGRVLPFDATAARIFGTLVAEHG